MNSNPKLTDDQLTPADFNKSIPEISPPLPETAENNEKLRQMDAIVNVFLERCRADIEKDVLNAEINEEKSRYLKKNIANCSYLKENVNISNFLCENVNPMDKNVAKCKDTKSDKFTQWYFNGDEIRTILRYSLLKQNDICRHFQISRSKFASLLQSKVVLPEITKFIANKIGVNTPAELREHYDMIPDEVKKAVRLDARISRPMKPGITIPSEVMQAAKELGKLAEVFNIAQIRDAEKNNYYKAF